jgi:peptidoglycan/xylan/chitin deacetylase (PgdA/CDA1 family)
MDAHRTRSEKKRPVAVLPSSRRSLGLFIVVAGHLAALLALFVMPWWVAAIVVLPAAFVVVWGTFNPHSRLFGSVVSRLSVGSARDVWLTFDDGPSSDTLALLDVLQAHAARATFFVVAERAQRHPAVVEWIMRRGHDIGNHTVGHPSAWFWCLPPARMRRQIGDAQSALAHLAGRAPRWFRSVAGQSNPFVDPVLRQLGLARASWTARGFDSVDGDDARVLRRLTRAIRPGAILMLHEDASRPGRCVRLTRALLDELSARGYSTVLPCPGLPEGGFATTSQLLNGVRPHRGVDVTVRPNETSSDSSASRVG